MRCQFSMAADQRITCELVIGPRTSGVVSWPTTRSSKTSGVVFGAMMVLMVLSCSGLVQRAMVVCTIRISVSPRWFV